ncbi:hypothetical protein L211DRAFT_850575 [Terfezia boudieri ATCC MYA-4762]|uniref:Uncharacterized protein n=1 Tax=Terfezia boudieri ATCC MYA-4762 TaxID=1051890 RepID=A0A3N4LI20_9PEZI|nr:hypothetical protein L211DRAFT_850575 [Terfezia boudieri ATCC MYA-4762]
MTWFSQNVISNVEGGLSTIVKIQCVKIQCLKLRLSSICQTSEEDDACNNISLLDFKFVDNESIILLERMRPLKLYTWSQLLMTPYPSHFRGPSKFPPIETLPLPFEKM